MLLWREQRQLYIFTATAQSVKATGCAMGIWYFCFRPPVWTGYVFSSPECVLGALCQGFMAAERETYVSVAEVRKAAPPHIYISWYLDKLLRLTNFRKYFVSSTKHNL